VNNVDVNGIAVFNVSLSSVFSNNNVQQIQLNPTNSNLQLVVINVYGTSGTWQNGNLVGDWFGSATRGQSRTIWNFYQAQSLTFSSSMSGTVLAPYATLTLQSSVNGAIAANTVYANAAVTAGASAAFPACVSMPLALAGQY
jgi:choice-of-anchor A domain-containing protein